VNFKHLGIAFAVFALIVPLACAHAYSSGGSGIPLPMPSTGTSSFDFNFGSSFQNLLTPFQAFFNSLTNSIGSQPVVGPGTSAGSTNSVPPIPTFNLQNVNLQNGPHEIDEWFLNLTHLSLGGIVKTILNFILWVLWLTQQFVQWLISLIH
jgi:hypothetical protein